MTSSILRFFFQAKACLPFVSHSFPKHNVLSTQAKTQAFSLRLIQSQPPSPSSFLQKFQKKELEVNEGAPSLRSAQVLTQLDALLMEKFAPHPFHYPLDRQEAEGVLKKYLAMSQAFPYLQAGAQKDYIFSAIANNSDISEQFEKTAVIGNFLCWDETGGLNLLSEKGMKALPTILNTQDHFHSNLLKKDLCKIFGKDLSPNYCEETKTYLRNLYDKLASPDHTIRVAMMVAFEMHAGHMIEALWNNVSQLFLIDKSELIYFDLHVGGEDPGEVYHMLMTRKLIDDLIPCHVERVFLNEFEKSYRLNFDWCQKISRHFNT